MQHTDEAALSESPAEANAADKMASDPIESPAPAGVTDTENETSRQDTKAAELQKEQSKPDISSRLKLKLNLGPIIQRSGT